MALHPYALLTEIHAFLNWLLHDVGPDAHPPMANVALSDLQLLFSYGNDLMFGGGRAHRCPDCLRLPTFLPPTRHPLV